MRGLVRAAIIAAARQRCFVVAHAPSSAAPVGPANRCDLMIRAGDAPIPADGKTSTIKTQGFRE
jgi:hypothetical protein